MVIFWYFINQMINQLIENMVVMTMKKLHSCSPRLYFHYFLFKAEKRLRRFCDWSSLPTNTLRPFLWLHLLKNQLKAVYTLLQTAVLTCSLTFTYYAIPLIKVLYIIADSDGVLMSFFHGIFYMANHLQLSFTNVGYKEVLIKEPNGCSLISYC